MKYVYNQRLRNIYRLICQAFLKNMGICEGKQSCSYTSLKNLFTDGEGIWKDPKGEEETYAMLLLPMEGNVLKYTANSQGPTAVD